jgi:hypothetical protein
MHVFSNCKVGFKLGDGRRRSNDKLGNEGRLESWSWRESRGSLAWRGSRPAGSTDSAYDGSLRFGLANKVGCTRDVEASHTLRQLGKYIAGFKSNMECT